MCDRCVNLGQPRQGFHAARVPVLDVALWDTVGTVAIAAGLAAGFGGGVGRWLAGLMALAVAAHAVCGTCTRLNRALGLCGGGGSRGA
jgi:hypothetical protein